MVIGPALDAYPGHVGSAGRVHARICLVPECRGIWPFWRLSGW
jgi:hypothetical protein